MVFLIVKSLLQPLFEMETKRRKSGSTRFLLVVPLNPCALLALVLFLMRVHQRAREPCYC